LIRPASTSNQRLLAGLNRNIDNGFLLKPDHLHAVALEATEQIQNQKDYQNGSEEAVGPVAVSITACRERSD
jgi:hypothetical protein